MVRFISRPPPVPRLPPVPPGTSCRRCLSVLSLSRFFFCKRLFQRCNAAEILILQISIYTVRRIRRINSNKRIMRFQNLLHIAESIRILYNRQNHCFLNFSCKVIIIINRFSTDFACHGELVFRREKFLFENTIILYLIDAQDIRIIKYIFYLTAADISK